MMAVKLFCTDASFIRNLSFCRVSFRALMLPFLICTVISIPKCLKAQSILNADGPGNTYELINSVFAPNGNVVETPDLSHASFGRHIGEVFDIELNKYVFEFYSHVSPDNDPATGYTDRQRVEIKTYDQSPDSLKGTIGELVTYKWRFKIPVGFQPSSNFTHIHQIKAVGGDDSDPLFTLTPRKSSPNKLELIYVADSSSGSTKFVTPNLSLFEGIWIDATETIKVGAPGTYSITLKKVSDGTILLSYTNNNIATIRLGAVNNSFIRPKWGIYRSLSSSQYLRNDSIRFSDFYIKEGLVSTVPVKIYEFKANLRSNAVNISWSTTNEADLKCFTIEHSADGNHFDSIANCVASGNANLLSNYSVIDKKPVEGKNFYRLKWVDQAGKFGYSSISVVFLGSDKASLLKIYPNPVTDHIIAQIPTKGSSSIDAVVTNEGGKRMMDVKGNMDQINQQLNKWLSNSISKGIYLLRIHDGNNNYYANTFLKQ